jgi:thiamine biosynthesis protein ThiI
MIKKGLTPTCVYFDNAPYADETTKQRAVEAVKKLRQYSSSPISLYVVPHGANLAEIQRKCPRFLTCVLCKRTMYRVSERIALKEGAEAIVTGEIIGEHASQTLRNLHVETGALSNVTILRPLAGMNKTEVESVARKIGTFDISARPAQCCSCPPKQPRTRARFEEVAEAEAKLDVEEMVTRSMEGASVSTI